MLRDRFGNANESDVRFFQHFRYKRKILFSIKKSGSIKVDLNSTDKQLHQLLNFDQTTSYSKQKDSQWKELEAFFVTRDTLNFRIFKDKDGCMQIHHNRYHFVGPRCKYICVCPRRSSYNTIDSSIEKLRSIFYTIGRDGKWDKRLGEGNPAAGIR